MTAQNLRQLAGLVGEIEDYERRRYEKSAWSLFVEDEETQRRRIDTIRVIGRLVAEIPDSLTRRAVKLRYVDGLSWQAVAARMGYACADTPRKMCARYLEKKTDAGIAKGLPFATVVWQSLFLRVWHCKRCKNS